MDLAIIGTGNTATVLGKLFKEKGHRIIEVNGRSASDTNFLAKELGAKPSYDLKQLTPHAEIYVIAVSDMAIDHISMDIHFEDKIVVHTAGSMSIQVLHHTSCNFGVLYPLQSMRKEIEDIPDIPFLIDGNNDYTKNALKSFAKTLSSNVQPANDLQRKKIHLAAVFVANFPNFLYALTENYCYKEKISFDILLPLIHETTNRLYTYPASTTQTGPAIREDFSTIENHLDMLQQYPLMKTTYLAFIQSILTWKLDENL
ncbi:MAG: DUF2520 domain-containing protein [Bacteroidetes bacterium]|nr:DUF2520 domain-containing protein [Bacteroidota bacterium]